MANKEVGDWNPMVEAHRNPDFNSYVEGPGSHLNTHQQPFNRRGGGGGRGRNVGSASNHSSDSEVRLYIANIPLDMTPDGLKNVLNPYAVPKRVYIHDKRKPGYSATWGTADFVTFGDAEATMRGCNEKPPYNFMMKFASKPSSHGRDRDNERRPYSPAASSAPQVNDVPLPEVQPKCDVRRKEALQSKLLIKNDADASGTSCPIIQETDKEGFFILPSGGEVMVLNAKNMSGDRRYPSEAGGWKMGINRKYYPPSPGNSETPRGAANSRSPNTPANSSQNNNSTNATDKVVSRQCKVCRTETSGVCGACKNASYCSQVCATADFRRHVTECYVPVPAVLFTDVGNQAVHSPGNQTSSPFTPLQNTGLPKNHHQFQNNDTASNNAANDVGAAGDGDHNVFHLGSKKENTTFQGEGSNRDTRPHANGDHKSVSNEPNLGDNMPVGRQSYQERQPTRDWQDKNGNQSTPTTNSQSVGRQVSPFNKQANDDKMSVTSTASTFKKKQRMAVEGLEIGIPEEVEVIFANIYGLYVVKTCNKAAVETLNNGLQSNWASMLPFDLKDELCAAPYEGGVYRAKVLQNKIPSTTKVRVKYVDFGNIAFLNTNEVKALPETFAELPAQAIQLKFVDASPDAYSSYAPESILNVTAINKVEGCWLVDVNQKKEVKDPQLSVQGHTVSPQKQPNAVAGSVSPSSNTTCTAVASTRPLVAEEQKSIGTVQRAAGTSCASEVPPLGVNSMLTVAQVLSEKTFWGTLNSRNGEIEAMEAKLNTHLEANPSPCQPKVQDLVAVFHEDCWYRGKVLKLTAVAKLGLIDYGKVIEVPLDKINTLPDELKHLPRHAVKYRISECPVGFLQVDKQISVQRTSAEPASDSCYLVDMVTQAEPCTQPEKKVPAKVADESSSVRPAGITSLAVEQLPSGEYTEVSIAVIAGRSFWVNMTANMGLAFDMLMKLSEHCNANPTPCQPQLGAIVAAPFGDEWYRAKVLAVFPKIRVMYVDFGNESDVTADQIKVLPKEFTLIPIQAIKITFSKSTSDKYYDLTENSTVRVKPVAGGEKSADGSAIVQVEGDILAQVEPKTCTPAPVATPVLAPAAAHVPVAPKGRWSPLQSVEIPSDTFVQLSITLPGETGYACLAENVNALNTMMCKMHEVVRQNHDICQPQVGVIVAALFDNIWHRGKVLSVTPQLQVGLVDYGNTCLMTPEDIRCLPGTYHDFPAQAFKIKFVDGTSAAYFNLDELARFDAKVIQKLPDGTAVIEARNLCLNKSEEQDTEPVGQPLAPVPAAIAPVPSNVTRAENSFQAPEGQDLHCSKIEALSSGEQQVMVSFTANGQMWVNSVAKADDLNQMMEALELLKGSLQPCNPKVGDYVAVYVQALEIWHRGQVRSVSSDTVSVFLIDYGCVEDASPNLVKVLPEQIAKLPAQAILIQLCPGSAKKCMSTNVAVDDIIYLDVLATTLEGIAVAIGLDK